MSFVYIHYETVRQLVDTLQNLDISKLPYQEQANFVLIDPRHYHGSFGGLVYDSILDKYSQKSHMSPFVYSSIGHGLSVVWWLDSKPPFTGDVFALSVENLVAVTPELYKQIKRNDILSKTPPVSRYYGKRAWRM